MSGQTSRREPVTVSDAVIENEHAIVRSGRLWVDVISGGSTGSGGDVQYTEGNTSAAIVGTAIMWEDAGDTLRPVSAATPLPVNIVSTVGSGGVQYDDGSASSPFRGTVSMAKEASGTRVRALLMDDVTNELKVLASQAGSWNIVNISGTITLPTGAATAANQALEVASLSVMDDWDESDRAKVNPIVGQAGVAAGAGSTGTTTQRVVLATDDLAVASLSVLDDWDETDRAKVNVIVGQAGITAGAGAVAANTPRVTHASDDPVTTSVQLIDDIVYTDDTSTHATGTSKGALMMAAATPTDTAVNANDIGALAMTLDRRLHVSVQDSALPSGGATSANQATEITSLQLIDDIVYTDDTSTHATGTSKGALMMAAATPTDAAVNANDIGAVAMTTDRKLHVSVQDALPAGNNNIGDVDVASIAAGNNNIGDVDIASMPNEGQQTMANSISVAIASDQAAYYFVTTPTNINTVFDASPTSATSGAFTVTPYRKFMFSYELISTSTPTDILFTVQFNNGGTWVDYRNNFWGQLLYDDVACASKLARAHSGDCVGTQMRIKAVATGTDGTKKFTVTNARVECKN